MKNQNRHLKRNLKVAIQDRRTVEQDNGKRLSLCAWRTLRAIHNAIAPQMARLRYTQDLLDRTTYASQGIDRQGYCVLIGDKYNGHVYATGRMESDLASVNDSFTPIRNRAMNDARNNTQAVDNSLALQTV